jgi:hypothetical protein
VQERAKSSGFTFGKQGNQTFVTRTGQESQFKSSQDDEQKIRALADELNILMKQHHTEVRARALQQAVTT